MSVRVSNSGNPVPANERTRIFERFYRGSEAHSRAPGSGLGLYVARKIAKSHGGSLDLEDGEVLEGRRPLSGCPSQSKKPMLTKLSGPLKT